ncbi:MAG: DNA starvation/stationary phase protection protein [Bacteroidetes bacterium]|nr:MAG: DNA starvation/stationary phase protection protein [Bacteroidota bacterium]
MNYLGINENNLSDTAHTLNQLLADYHIYYQNLRNFHWNIRGENFFDLHAQFEALYSDARTRIDAIAERILTLRHRPVSLFSDYLEMAEVREDRESRSDREMVLTVLDNHRILITRMREVLDAAQTARDEGTTDLVSGFLQELEKKSWMLQAWAARKAAPVPA